MEDSARERLALNAYLAQIENLHVAFGVKQRTPEKLDTAVTATLELESYLSPKMMTVAGVEFKATECETASCGAMSEKPVSVSNEQVISLAEKLMEKVDRLETNQHQEQERSQRSGGQATPNGAELSEARRRSDTCTCWSCGRSGHIAWQCRFRKSQPEN